MGESAERFPALLPREHGASMELGFALLTAFSLARPTPASLALGVSAILVFVAHESFMLLIGRRGERRRIAQRVAAWRTMLALGAVATALALYGALGLSILVLATLAIPIVLAAPAVLLALRGLERSLVAELFVVAGLVSVSLPVALASGASLDRVLSTATIWLVCFTVGTFVARGVLYRAKDDGRGLRVALVAALIVASLSLACAALGWVPLRLALAPLPSAIVAILIAWRPPSPKKMTRLGLGLTGASLATFLLLLC